MPEERNYLIGILAENHEFSENIGGTFGKSGQKTDLQFYDRLDSQLNAVFCAIDAIAYPEKLKSLIHTMMITDFHLLLIDADKGITPAIGEIIIMMDIFVREFGAKAFVAIGNIDEKNEYKVEDLETKTKKIMQSTGLKDSIVKIIRTKEDREDIKTLIYETGKNMPLPTLDKSQTIVNIDHVFPVKGIGTVILGVVKSGQVAAGEMLNLIGLNKKVIVRSIQKQDRDFKTAEGGDRVGLAIKGIKPEDIERGFILAAPDLYTTSRKFKIEVKVNQFFKNELSPESARQYHLFIGLAMAPFKIISGEILKPGQEGLIEVETSKEIPVPLKNGKGIIAELNKFENKLRIVGFFKIKSIDN